MLHSSPLPVRALLIASGLAGLLAGLFLGANWQHAIEPAQVMSGVVVYDWPTPFYIYQAKAWTIIHPIVALALSMGATELGLSLAISSLISITFFQGISLCVLVFSRSFALSLFTPMLVAWLFHRHGLGDVYRVLLVGSQHTYGQLGYAMMLLGLSLLGVGWRRAGAFVIALCPAVHIVLGLFAWMIVFTAGAWDREFARRLLAQTWRYFAAGAAIAAMSFALHAAWFSDVPGVDAATAGRYLEMFTPWEWYHRMEPTRFRNPVYLYSVLTLLLGGLWLTTFHRRDELAGDPIFFCRILIVASAGALSAGLLHQWPEDLPSMWSRLMPARLAALTGLLGIPLLLATLSAPILPWPVRVLGPAVLVAALAIVESRLGFQLLPRVVVPLAIVTIALGAFSQRLAEFAPRRGSTAWNLTLVTAAAILLMAAVPATQTVARTLRDLEAPWQRLARSGSAEIFDTLSSGTGILLGTAEGVEFIQLRSRRPILISNFGTSATVIPYIPEAGPSTERIWRELIGVDPARGPTTEGISHANAATELSRRQRALWESWDLDAWTRLSTEFAFTEVLAPHDWDIRLPVRRRFESLVLYAAPLPR